MDHSKEDGLDEYMTADDEQQKHTERRDKRDTS